MIDTPRKHPPMSVVHLTRLLNHVQQEQERAHLLMLRYATDLPNLAAHYSGEEAAFGLVKAMLEGTLKGIEGPREVVVA